MAYTVSLVSDTSRSPTLRRPSSWQGERGMSAPRQVLSTQLCSHPTINYLYVSIYIPQNCSSLLFQMIVALCLGTVYFCYLRLHFSSTT